VQVRLYVFGKLKTPGLREAADHYLRMISGWVKVEEIELKPVAVPDKSAATRLKIQKKEEELVLSKIPVGAPLFLMDETGREQNSRAWSSQARKWEDSGQSVICLCIGSSLGFSDGLKSRAAGSFSLGPQTMSHELARLNLLEQLYRAWSILRGHPYHVEG
jgi:23S rRNA (pseudouridine1915-N3)-methyltransferase